MGVNFCRGDRGMTEKFLDDAKVGAVFEQVSRETMAQHVWRDVALDTGTTSALFDPKPEGDGGEGGTTLCKENSA